MVYYKGNNRKNTNDSEKTTITFESMLKKRCCYADSIANFDKTIGLNKLLVVHVNDSKNPVGAHKDRHENIGYGCIGFDALNKVVHHPLLKGIPMILETPYFESNPPYKKEIEMFRKQRFENWR